MGLGCGLNARNRMQSACAASRRGSAKKRSEKRRRRKRRRRKVKKRRRRNRQRERCRIMIGRRKKTAQVLMPKMGSQRSIAVASPLHLEECGRGTTRRPSGSHGGGRAKGTARVSLSRGHPWSFDRGRGRRTATATATTSAAAIDLGALIGAAAAAAATGATAGAGRAAADGATIGGGTRPINLWTIGRRIEDAGGPRRAVHRLSPEPVGSVAVSRP